MKPLRAGDPHQIGNYRLLGRLSAGGTREVFLGESPTQRKVSVRLIKGEYADDREFRQRFAQEVAVARMMGGFHTAPVVDADPDGDPPWLVTAYIPGPSLFDAVRQNGPLPLDAARGLGGTLAEGLAMLHTCGLVHRDFEPGNVTLPENGPPVIDFGLTRTDAAAGLASSGVNTSSGVIAGAISYMPPEQVSGDHVDFPSDVFSLGCVLAYAATGRSPFAAGTIPAIASRIIGGEPTLDGIDGPLRAIIEDCLAKDPDTRPTMATVATRLTGHAFLPPVPDQSPYTEWTIADDPEPTTMKALWLGQRRQA
ncbi:MAG: serine/threonine protein kinase [Nocardiopsaceae bacterium]|nr:serine/threonine protein kinase [Nocardiopsaceae bacterium]